MNSTEIVKKHYRVYEIKVAPNGDIYKQSLAIIGVSQDEKPSLEEVKLVDGEWVETW